MTFLQPWMLLALPMIALPVIIHLINQWRFESVEWAAMRFLLAAKALSRGYSRLRQWLILLLRMLAVAAAILAISRPLSRGWLAAMGGEQSAAIVLLDRSPSMSQGLVAGGESKLATARRHVAGALETLGTSRVILLDSVNGKPLDLATPRALLDVPEGEPAASPADLPRLLQEAVELLHADPALAGSIWICSDQRADDWKPGDGAWPAIREALRALPRTVRVNLLAFTDPAPDNLAVRVTRATYEPRGKGWELLLDITLSRQADSGQVRVPIGIDLGGARSTLEIDLTGTETAVARHPIPVDPATLAAGADSDPALVAGWGKVSIPADANPADNEAYFAFGKAPKRRTIVVADDPSARRALELIAGIPPDKLLSAAVEVVAVEGAAGMTLDDVALVLWQAPLPRDEAAAGLDRFVDRGGQVIFLPPESPGNGSFSGIAWKAWEEHSPPLRPASWRTDEGPLAATLAGTNLPVGEVEVRRLCGMAGEGTPLATLPGDLPLLLRVPRDHGGVSFLATTPTPRDSDLAANGVVLYALIQRAIDDGQAAVGTARLADAGAAFSGGVPGSGAGPSAAAALDGWRQIAGPPFPSSEAGFHAGVLESRGRLLAINRPPREDAAPILPDDQIEKLFQGLSFSRLEHQAGGLGNIVEEVWRTFLVGLLMLLAAEGLLCLPQAAPHRMPGRPAEAVA